MRNEGGEDITQLLAAAAEGSEKAQSLLYDRVHRELRALAASQMRGERPGHILQPTALVHEVYLKFVGKAAIQFQDRKHFFRTAARAMRRLLVDNARAEKAGKRGGNVRRVELTDCTQILTESPDRQIDFHGALERLQAIDARQGQIIELLVFGGHSKEEIAAMLEVTTRTVEREIASATLWLRRELSGAAF